MDAKAIYDSGLHASLFTIQPPAAGVQVITSHSSSAGEVSATHDICANHDGDI